MQADILSLSDALARWESQWISLATEVDVNATALPGWLQAAIGTEAVADIDVFVESREGRLVSAVPFRIERRKFFKFPLACLDLTAGSVRYHTDIASTRSIAECVAQCLTHTQRRWSVVCATNVVVGSPLHEALLAASSTLGCIALRYPAERSPVIQLPGTWEELIAPKPKKFRYQIRRRASDCSQERGYTMRWVKNESDVDGLLVDMLKIEQGSWKRQVGRAISDSEKETDYYRRLLPWLARSGFLRANVLYKEGRPIAYNLCCRFQGWMGQLKTSFLESEATGSPGAHLIDRSIESSIAEGCSEFDFLGDADVHKLAWSKTVRVHEDLFLFRRSPIAGPIGLAKSFLLSRRKSRKVDAESAQDDAT